MSSNFIVIANLRQGPVIIQLKYTNFTFLFGCFPRQKCQTNDNSMYIKDNVENQ